MDNLEWANILLDNVAYLGLEFLDRISRISTSGSRTKHCCIFFFMLQSTSSSMNYIFAKIC